MFFPEASDDRCTAALVVDVDPVGLVRTGRQDDIFALGEYTNDRPYVASSLLCVAISRVFGAALGGRSRERPALAAMAIPLEANLPAVPARGAERLVRGLFEPLGYTVDLVQLPLAPDKPEFGQSPYYSLTLQATLRLSELLRHLTVLIPVLDNDKHYWVGSDEVDKLLDRGDGWLAEHPLREVIVQRYLRHQRSLARAAKARLSDDQPPEVTIADDETAPRREALLEAPHSLDDRRREAVIAALKAADAKSIVDVGCGEGKLVRALARERWLHRITGMDVSPVALERAARRLGHDSHRADDRISLIQGSLTYRDTRLRGHDAACAVEVIEHIEPTRLAAFEDALFVHTRIPTILVTTPNREYNVRFPALADGRLRHSDHRFEWTRAEFHAWATGVGERCGYTVEFVDIGDVDPELGPPTQMGVFRR